MGLSGHLNPVGEDGHPLRRHEMPKRLRVGILQHDDTFAHAADHPEGPPQEPAGRRDVVGEGEGMELNDDRPAQRPHGDQLDERADRRQGGDTERVEPDDIGSGRPRRSGDRECLAKDRQHILEVQSVRSPPQPVPGHQSNRLVTHLGKRANHLVGHRGDAAADQCSSRSDNEYLHATSMTATDHSPGDLDVIVVSWNSAPHLGAALAALPDWVRVIVVDNESADTSVDVARAHGAEVVEMGHNAGFPAAVNAGLSAATAPAVLLLNPDLVVGPGTIERCLDELDRDATIGLVGPATTTPTGRPEPAAARHDRRAWHIAVESLGLVHLDRRFDRQMVHDRSCDQDVDSVNGAFMLVRTELLRALGGLDTAVFMYLEDADLCRRVRDAGFRVRFVAGATAVHEGGASTAQGTSDAQTRAYLHRIDADVEFVRRYGFRCESALAIAAFVLRAVVGLLVSVVRPTRRARYRSALIYTLRQLRGRRAPEAV